MKKLDNKQRRKVMPFGNYETKNNHSREFFSNSEIFDKNSRPSAEFKLLFKEKVNKLTNFYNIEDIYSLKLFLKEHNGSFDLLDEVKPILEDVFPGKDYNLRVILDPEFDYSTLMIIVKLDYSDEPIEKTFGKLNYASSRFRKIKRQKIALNDILIDVESV